MIKSRTEIALARLLSRCQEMAASTEDISAEWRLPKFIASCEEMLGSLVPDWKPGYIYIDASADKH